MTSEQGYVTISVKPTTRDRLDKKRITPGEYWDDLFNRLLNELEA